jgi:nucleoside-diphosphate-sugar epimerase
MKVFVAGATGAVGSRLVPALRAAGHDVVAMTRSADKAAALRSLGAVPVVADALDASACRAAIAGSAPDVVVHQLTELAGLESIRNFDAVFARTNRLRTAGTDNLLAGATEAGVRRFVAQSYGGWIYGRSGGRPTVESDPLDAEPLPNQRRSLEAIRHLEAAVVGARQLTGVALRYGNFYGPGTNLAVDGSLVRAIRRRMLPVIGNGAGVWSFIHVDDAASAALAAVERGMAGVYNVADDAPTPASEWIPELARMVGAPPPRHVPVWLGRLLAGDVVVSLMTQIPGMSNEKAKRELGWRPSFSTWREGFRDAASPLAPASRRSP